MLDHGSGKTWPTSEHTEHTESDDYWGDGGDGRGRNRLGRILMEVREALRG